MKTRRFKTSMWSSVIEFFLSPVLALYTIYKWNRSLALFDKWESEFGSDRIKLFAFEDIGADAEKVAASLADFLDLGRSNLSLENVKVVDSSFSGSVSMRRWDRRLSPMGGFFFETLARSRMESMGYRRRGEDVRN